MKKFALIAIVILTLSLAAFGQKPAAAKTPAAKPDPTKGVREAFDRLVDGIETLDVAKVMSVYNNSENILFFNNNGSVTRGWEQMKQNRESSYAKTSNVNLETTGVRIEMLGSNAAYLTCKWRQMQDYNGKPEAASGRMTIVFQLINKEWKAVHLHTSPDAPDTARPVLPSERQ